MSQKNGKMGKKNKAIFILLRDLGEFEYNVETSNCLDLHTH